MVEDVIANDHDDNHRDDEKCTCADGRKICCS